MKVTVIKQHPYRQKQRMVGDCYEARDRDVPILRQMKLVEAQRDLPAPRAKKTRNKKRRYRRRDMKAGS